MNTAGKIGSVRVPSQNRQNSLSLEGSHGICIFGHCSLFTQWGYNGFPILKHDQDEPQ
jgi:hypothetical protein